MDETPPDQFLSSPYPYYDSLSSPSCDHFNNNVYLGNIEGSGDIGNSNWQNNPYGNISGLGTIPVNDYYNNNGPLEDYSTPKPFVGGASDIDINNNVVSSNSFNSNSYEYINNVGSNTFNTNNYDPNINNNYPATTTSNYYDYTGSSYTSNSNYTSSSDALSSFTVPNATVDGAATNGIANTGSIANGVVSISEESQPVKNKEENKQPLTRGIANSVLLASRVAQLGDGIPTGIVPSRVPGGKETKIAIATDSLLAPAKHHIARIFNKHGITTSFSPNLEKLTEITGNVAYLFLLYKEYCRKRRCKTVNRETYGKIFRNEFKRKVGVR